MYGKVTSPLELLITTKKAHNMIVGLEIQNRLNNCSHNPLLDGLDYSMGEVFLIRIPWYKDC